MTCTHALTYWLAPQQRPLPPGVPYVLLSLAILTQKELVASLDDILSAGPSLRSYALRGSPARTPPRSQAKVSCHTLGERFLVGQTQPTACLCTASDLRTVFTFLNVWGKNPKKNIL